MSYKKIILTILSVYLIMFVLKLDKLDMLSIYYVIKYKDIISGGEGEDGIDLYKKIIYILKGLCIPFCESTYYARMTRGGSYGAIFYDKEPILTEKMNKKLYWSYIFSLYNINYPLTFLYTKNKKIYGVRKIIDEDYYIAKPNIGGYGINVNRIKGCDVKKYCKTHNNIIVQQCLVDCIGYPKHFRYVTLHDGTEFNIYILEQKNSSSVTSNFNQGGIRIRCPFKKCPGLNKLENLALRTTCKKLKNLHKKKFNSIFSIGWDIMLNCDKGHNSKAYVLEGNTPHCSWTEESSDKHKILEYKTKLKKFLNI